MGKGSGYKGKPTGGGNYRNTVHDGRGNSGGWGCAVVVPVLAILPALALLRKVKTS